MRYLNLFYCTYIKNIDLDKELNWDVCKCCLLFYMLFMQCLLTLQHDCHMGVANHFTLHNT